MVFARFIEKVLNQLLRPKLFLICPIFSGLLLGIGFILPQLGFLTWFSLLPLLFFLHSKKISSKQAFGVGCLTGVVFLGQVMVWGFDAWSLRWLGVENEVIGLFLIVLLWSILIVFLSLFIGFFSLSYWKIKERREALFLAPALWVIFEYLRSWGFGIFFISPESLLGPHWTFGNLAYMLAQNQTARLLAGWGGIYLVSFLIILINVLIFFFIRKSKKSVFLIFILILLSYFLPLTGDSTENQTLKVAVVQTKFSSTLEQTSEVSRTRLEIQQNLVGEALASSPGPDIMVLPENSHFFSYWPDAAPSLSIFKNDFLIIDSDQSVASIFQSRRGLLAQHQKTLLVPIGDYLPSFIKWLGLLINSNWVEEVENKRMRQYGGEIKVSGEDTRHIGVLFCSEAVSPQLYRGETQEGAEVIFNIASLAFSQGSKILEAQTLAMLQLRASENGRYLVRSTNYGTSYIIDNRGKIEIRAQNLDNQVLFGEIILKRRETFYTKYGEWVLTASLFLALTFISIRVIIYYRKKKVEF